MAVLVTKSAPDFKAQAVMPNCQFEEISLSQYLGKYVILFFYPLDFTFVCPTEIIAFSDQLKEFDALNTQVIGVSIDSHFSHLAWRQTGRELGGLGQIDYPLVADLRKTISRDYDVLVGDAVALRGLFFIDKEGIVRHQTVNDDPIGRSVDEALRVVKAWQHFEQFGQVCPANWNTGKATIKPTVDGSKEFFGSEFASKA